MTTNTVSQFEMPMAERSIEGGRGRDDQRGTKSDFKLPMLCFVLTAVIFGLIHTIAYFTASNSPGGISAESVMAPEGNNTPFVLPPVLP